MPSATTGNAHDRHALLTWLATARRVGDPVRLARAAVEGDRLGLRRVCDSVAWERALLADVDELACRVAVSLARDTRRPTEGASLWLLVEEHVERSAEAMRCWSAAEHLARRHTAAEWFRLWESILGLRARGCAHVIAEVNRRAHAVRRVALLRAGHARTTDEVVRLAGLPTDVVNVALAEFQSILRRAVRLECADDQTSP